MHLKLHSLITVLIATSLSSQVLATVAVSPAVITKGKSTTVELHSDSPVEISDIILSPGGPLLQQRLPLTGPDHSEFRVKQKRNELQLQQQIGGEWQTVARFQDKRKTSIKDYLPAVPILDVATQGKLAMVANGQYGLTILDTSRPGQPLWLGSHQKLGRVIRTVADNGRALVLNDRNTIFMVDIGNPKEPTVLNAYRSRDTISDIALNHETVYARGQDAIEIIDFSAPPPQISNEGLDYGQGVNFGGERRLYIEGNLAYVADWFSGIHIYDISRPMLPILVSSFHTPGSPKGIVVRDGVAYVADDDHGLLLIDVSNPLEPKKISALQTKGLGYTPKLVGNLLFLASHRGGFQIIDISQPTKPRLVGEYDTPGKSWSIEIRGQLAYVADDDSGLLIFNVADPTQPQLIGQFASGTAAEEVVIRDNLAFVAFFNDGLYILDIAEPAQPKLISHTAIPGNSRGLDLQGDLLYVASWLAGVHIINVHDITAPQILSSYDTRGATWGLKVKNNYLYAMDWWGGFVVLDIKDESRPIAVGGYHERGQVNDIALHGNYAFVAHGSNGLQVFDIKNPLNPTWTTGENFSGDAQKIILKNEFAYLAMEDGGLAIADISDPYQIRWLSSTKTQGSVSDLAITNDHAFLIDSRQGIVVLDIINPLQPRQLFHLNTQARHLVLNNGKLIAATAEGIEIYNINRDGSLTPHQQLTVAGGIQHLASHGKAIYATQGKKLFAYSLDKDSFKLNNETGFTDEITAVETDGKHLLISSQYNLIQMAVATNGAIQQQITYPLLSEPYQLSLHKNGVVYIGGEKTITTLQLLPLIPQKNIAQGHVELSIPATLPEGRYHVSYRDNTGQHQVLKNALGVVMPKFSKPKLSMDEFKKLLEQKKDSDLFPQSNK